MRLGTKKGPLQRRPITDPAPVPKPSSYHTNVRLDTIRDIRIANAEAILEIGGGSFETLAELARRFDARAVGIDLVDMCSDPAIDVVVGSLDSADVFAEIPNETFDLMIANDVLEHVRDPLAVLNQLFRVSKVNSYLHISVPNIRQVRALYHIFVGGTFPQTEAGLFDRTHLRWFCRRDILDLIEAAGFDVETSYMRGRLVPAPLRETRISEFFGLQTIVIAKRSRC